MENPFSGRMIRTQARACGFLRRKSRGIGAVRWCVVFVRVAAMRAPTLKLLGSVLGAVSAVAVWKRVERGGVELLRAVFAQLVGQEAAALRWRGKGRILVHDSTVLALPKSCAARYPGAANQKGSRPHGRWQCVLDVLTGQLVYAALHPFRRNDQAAAADLLEVARAGDLIVRDRGYQSMSCWNQYLSRGVDLLSRLRFGLVLGDPFSGVALSLGKLLRAGHRLDMRARLGSTLVRVVAIPLSCGHAAHRRRLARANRDARLHHSREYYRQLGWAIFITTVPKEQLPAEHIAALYRLRWRIEIVFKAAKSHLWHRDLPARTSVRMVEALLWARMILLWLHLRWHRHMEKPGQRASLLASAQIFAVFLEHLLPLPKLTPQLWRSFTTTQSRPRPSYQDALAKLQIGLP
jgi:hypothetical protein